MTDDGVITWVEDTAAGDAVITDVSAVPVLAPCDPARRRRWESTLTWYAKTTEPQAPTCVEGGVVVALGDAYTQPARYYAHRLGRQFIQVQSLDEVESLAKRGASSVMVWADPTRFDVPTLGRLGQALAGFPWGVVTAPDLPAATFMMAKMLLAGPGSCAPWTVVGGDGQIVVLGDEPRVEASDAPDRLHERIERAGSAGLSLAAHGDGSHLDASGLILCGGLGDCAGGERCERATGGTPSLFLRDVRTRCLLLATCHGFALDQVAYPAGAGIALAAVEGHVANVITTVGRTGSAAAEVLMLTTMLHEGAGAGAVQCLANELHMRSEGRRPWVVIGDPAGRPVPSVEAGEDGAFPVPPGRRAFRIGMHQPEPGLVSLAAPAGTLQRGAQSGAVLRSDPESDAAGHGRLEDRTPAWLEQDELTAELERCVARSRRALLALADLWPHERQSLEASTAQLLAINAEAERLVHEQRHRLGQAAQMGCWDPDVPRFHAVIEDCLAIWDRSFAETIAGRVMGEGGAGLLTAGHHLLGRSEHGSCDRCGAPVTGATFGSDGRDEKVTVVSCPVCGLDEAWEGRGPRLGLVIPETARLGTSIEVGVQLEDWDSERPGWVVVQLRDNIRSTVIDSCTTVAEKRMHDVTLEMPVESPAGLCTVDAVWVRGMRVGFRRAVF